MHTHTLRKMLFILCVHMIRLAACFTYTDTVVGTNKDCAYGTVPPPGSKIDTISSADAGATGSILATQCAAGTSSYADAAAGRNSYANAARRALKLPARSA
jgi:hypothetical protein